MDSTAVGPAGSPDAAENDMSTQPTTRRKHPHFDDRGTLDWHTSFADAQAAARREGKRIFVEIGREL